MNETEQVPQDQTASDPDTGYISYRQQLTAHRALIERIAGQYRTPSGTRVQWERALKAEPDLVSLLMVGPGSHKDQLDRLKNVYQYWHGSKSAPKTRQPQVNWKGKPSKCSKFDQHYDELMSLADQYRQPNGKVSWKEAMRNNPELARAVDYTESHKSLTLLTFWYRSRRGIAALGRRPLGALRAVPASTPQPQHRRNGTTSTITAPAVRFCSHCGHPIGLDVLASDVVRSMTTAGLTQDQIVSTLTRAAAAITKMTAPATTTQDTTHES